MLNTTFSTVASHCPRSRVRAELDGSSVNPGHTAVNPSQLVRPSKAVSTPRQIPS
ncbi:hypothetical protein [Nocardia cyriacigeorgica]|uniref:hypothetical protein n=1 Tax=Nocardia cyriacigeorgica TaxID=135487 RepID=UPI003D80BB1D